MFTGAHHHSAGARSIESARSPPSHDSREKRWVMLAEWCAIGQPILDFIPRSCLKTLVICSRAAGVVVERVRLEWSKLGPEMLDSLNGDALGPLMRHCSHESPHC